MGGLNRSEGLVGCECNVVASVDLQFGSQSSWNDKPGLGMSKNTVICSSSDERS